jgi:hypothetical protein
MYKVARIIVPFALPTGMPWWPMSYQLQRNAAIMLFFFGDRSCFELGGIGRRCVDREREKCLLPVNVS